MTGTDIRHALHAIGDTLPAPAPDRLAFQREVRRERRRRTTGRSLVAAAAVACVGVVATLAGEALPSDPGPAATSSPGGSMTEEVEPFYGIVDGQLVALYGSQPVPLGVPAEEIMGYTAERVYALDNESRIEVRAQVDDPEGPEPAGFVAEPSPYSGPVQSGALSADGRFLAWLTLEGTITVFDTVAGAVAYSFDAAPNSYVADVAETGVLVSEDGNLVLRDADRRISVPTHADGYGWSSQVVGDTVLVNDRDNTVRVYDVVQGEVTLREELPGLGTLSPVGDAIAFVGQTPAGAVAPQLWDGRTSRPFTDLVGTVDGVRWVTGGGEAGVVLAQGHDSAGQPRLWVCSPQQLSCGEHAISGTDVTIGE